MHSLNSRCAQENLIAGFKHKVPKVAVASIDVLVQGIRYVLREALHASPTLSSSRAALAVSLDHLNLCVCFQQALLYCSCSKEIYLISSLDLLASGTPAVSPIHSSCCILHPKCEDS